jgi:hypothetical protein
MRNTYNSFWVVQLHASRKATLCKQAKLRNDELVELAERLVWGTRMAHGRTHLLWAQLHRVGVMQKPREQSTLCYVKLTSLTRRSDLHTRALHQPDFACLGTLRGSLHDNGPLIRDGIHPFILEFANAI